MWLLLASAVAVPAFAHSEASPPLVYSVENSGGSYPAPTFPAFDYLPIVRPLPDPFRFFDGTRSTSFADWERRRAEIKAAFLQYEIGPRPDGSDCTVTAAYTPPAAGSQSGTLSVTVTRKSNGQSLTLTERVWLPDAQTWGPGPYPALIPMTWFAFGTGANYGSMPAAVFSTRPIATIDFKHDDVAQYFSFGAPNHPFLRLYPEFNFGAQYDASQPGNIGKYAAWTWGISRLIDGIIIAANDPVNPLPIDVKHLAVTGCSYAGKMALFAGALDERIALTLPQESGGGGATAWRVSQEIQGDTEVETATRTDYSWFASPLRQFSRNDIYKLPIDHHEIMAMVAPRALLTTANASQRWLSSKANYVAARATERVYEQFGIADRFGFIIDTDHGHCAVPESEYEPIGAFVDKFLLGDTSANTYVREHLYEGFDYARWTWWWGKPQPKFPNDYTWGEGKLVMSMNRPIEVRQGTEVKAGYAISLSGNHPQATALLVGGSAQVDIVAPDGRSRTLTIPFKDQDFVIPANDSSWYPSPNQKSPLVWQGSAMPPFSGRATNHVFSAIGKGQPADGSGAGSPAGPGLVTDTGDLVNVRFHVDGGQKGAGGSWSPTVTTTDDQEP
jgi:hypothetical protein